MSRKREKLKFTKNRVVLSDVLPYELPITLSNRRFYDFLNDHKVQLFKGSLKWKKSTKAVDNAIKILFGLGDKKTIVDKSEVVDGHTIKLRVCTDYGRSTTIPFAFKITHKEDQHREITICHPRNQLAVVEFYDRFKEAILYFSSKSNFSIRHPSKIANFVYRKDKLHRASLSDGGERIEEEGKEYKNLRSFFRYDRYSNVYKFYEDYLFHRCEKKYEHLVKLDISKCFDSIYTHSICWAIYGKDASKENLKRIDGTFADSFDILIRDLNYNETNGIIIGPEFSRIFAELILQRVDHDVRVRIEKQSTARHKIDFEVFRYVDDYFVFYNGENVRKLFFDELQTQLKIYKLTLNTNKTEVFEKPIITDITIAKNKISDLFRTSLSGPKAEDTPSEEPLSEEEVVKAETEKIKKRLSLNSRKLITRYKTIIRETGVGYADMMNYALAIIDRKTRQLIVDFFKSDQSKSVEKKMANSLLAIIEFTFFVYSVSPKVNFTVKLCSILQSCIVFLKRNDGDKDFKHLLFKSISDNSQLILRKNQVSMFRQVETLYLLITLQELGKDYWLQQDQLAEYVGIKRNESGKYEAAFDLNFLVLTVLLFYVRNKLRYQELRLFAQDALLDKFNSKPSIIQSDTELCLMFFDAITCPYIDMAVKRELIKLYGVSDPVEQDELINLRSSWFTNWNNLKVREELDAKRSQEVY